MARPSWQNSARWFRWPLSVAIIVFMVVGFYSAERRTDNGYDDAATLIWWVLAAPLIVGHVYLYFIRPTRSTKSANREGHPSVEELLARATDMLLTPGGTPPTDSRSQTIADVTTGQFRLFGQSITDASTLRRRVVEQLHPHHRALRQQVSINLSFSPLGPQSEKFLYIPILLPKKGELQDDLDISFGNGTPVTTLNYAEFLDLVVTAIVAAITRADVRAPGDPKSDRVRALVHQAVALISQRGPVNDAVTMQAKQCADKIREYEQYAQRNEALRSVAVLVERLTANFAIVGLIPVPDSGSQRVLIKYERFVIPTLKLRRGVLGRVKDWSCIALGSRPVRLVVSLGSAALAQSYHLNIFGPEGMYAGKMKLVGLDEVLTSHNTGRTIDRPYYRLRRRLGQRYVHAYLRSLPPAIAEKSRLEVEFYEIPPGSIAKAAVAAAATLFLTYTAGANLTANLTVNGAFPALILTFPAVAAALIGFESHARLFEATFAARVSSLVIIATALGASALYMSQAAGRLRAPIKDWDFMLVTDWWWLLLVAVASLNFLGSSYLWLMRSVTYTLLATRDVHAAAVDAGKGLPNEGGYNE